ncbi:MAG: hypothetical protein ABSB19_14345, partial [Methylomonas sp.]
QTLLDRLLVEILPKATSIQERLAVGELMDHWDMEVLEEMIRNAEQIQPMVDRHPEHQALYSRVVHLYKQILDQAQENENK